MPERQGFISQLKRVKEALRPIFKMGNCRLCMTETGDRFINNQKKATAILFIPERRLLMEDEQEGDLLMHIRRKPQPDY